ncbi:MAG: lipopolysaccharide transport periplasmic protein LptA [Betaproteobacteria bacterium RIFCSPLOWO2_12_FULL_67_28]|nr:MAG: lipopolysaccharide transport periplasmic protein LptA [Betaproteobacteria bacterium RIFCSPLOWO2_02_FULL_68_150]OGA66976.1 MAG: lipopolysaccharide transport periplasmic protein LptA [Betaproteobacteria bacterium RIFCSPLOWO2_12_FULL_67_28]
MPTRHLPIAAVAAALLCLPMPAAHAEKADRSKPTRLEADRMSADDARRISIFEGNVVLSKGTISVHADRIVVRQDADGFQHATATGKPARFRQRSDPRGEREGVWAEAEALRVEIDDRNEKVELHERARVLRDQDEVRGEYIALDQRTEVFSASAAKGAAPAGRVRAVIQPKAPGAAPPAGPGKPDADKPPAR